MKWSTLFLGFLLLSSLAATLGIYAQGILNSKPIRVSNQKVADVFPSPSPPPPPEQPIDDESGGG